MGTKRWIAGAAILSLLATPVMARAANSGQGGMSGPAMEGQGMTRGPSMQGGHDMMEMGTRAYSGRMGPWTSQIRVIDMKAQLKAAGMQAQGAMTNTHHIALSLTSRKTKTRVAQGTGAVTVIGPDKSMRTYDMTGMQGHFGADVDLSRPGRYTFNVKMESGGKTGTAVFHYRVK
jgi:hypothetical protein